MVSIRRKRSIREGLIAGRETRWIRLEIWRLHDHQNCTRAPERGEARGEARRGEGRGEGRGGARRGAVAAAAVSN